MRMRWAFILSGLLSVPVSFAQVFDRLQLPNIIERFSEYMENPYLQYIFVVVSLWTIAYCIFMMGMLKAEILIKDRNTLNKQGKILCATLAAFLPFMYIFATRSQNIEEKIVTVIGPASYVLGWMIALTLPPIIYFSLNKLPWFSEEGTQQAPAPTPPRGT
ncbi:hypothetical protein HY641_03200 [Candidatus Woesearchaeota archaeon]|nr:hypothetical protein [Candidatus Woesearchaeota archaeon]